MRVGVSSTIVPSIRTTCCVVMVRFVVFVRSVVHERGLHMCGMWTFLIHVLTYWGMV